MLKDPALANETLFGNIRRAIETHAEMTSYLTLLLATLGIMIGLFTVTGFINRMGAMLLDLGAWNIIAMIFMAWIFGWLAGAGLPPTATYIIGAVVIVRPMQELGINPWVAHFFVFLMSVWGELSPPTSLTAAVSARIANASFLRTMYEALKICAPITLMTFAIFTRSNMVMNPGWPQIADTILVLDQHLRHHVRDVRAIPREAGRRHRCCASLLALVSFVTMFHPDTKVSAAVAIAWSRLCVLGIWRHRIIAPPKTAAVETRESARVEAISGVLAEAGAISGDRGRTAIQRGRPWRASRPDAALLIVEAVISGRRRRQRSARMRSASLPIRARAARAVPHQPTLPAQVCPRSTADAVSLRGVSRSALLAGDVRLGHHLLRAAHAESREPKATRAAPASAAFQCFCNRTLPRA